MNKNAVTIPLILLLNSVAWGQQPTAPPNETTIPAEDYRIGPEDLIEIAVFGIQNSTTSVRVSATGNISYQPVGDLKAMGLTPPELSRTIEERLKTTGVRNPRVQVMVREFATQPVSIVGAVRSPNIYQIKGQKTLIDMLAMAGDRTESAGATIQVIRGDSTIVIAMTDLYQKGAQFNVPVYAGDRIIVLEAQHITVVGEVVKQGQFPLKYGKNLTVMEAWALGGGPTNNAKKKDTVILREHTDGVIEEIPVDMDKLLARQIQDPEMLPGDVLYVPASAVRSGVRRVLDTVISVGISRAIYAP